MADKLRQLMSVTIGFTDGERPTADKFNALVAQTKRSIEILEYVVGDARSQSWPYMNTGVDLNGNYLTIPYGRRLVSNEPVEYAATSQALRGRPLDIVCLSRLIGPASNLNPITVPQSEREITEEIPRLVFEYELNHCAIEEFISVTASGAPMARGVTGRLEENEWGIIADKYGQVTKIVFHNGTPDNCQVTYTTDLSLFGGSGNYHGATFNVIPDPAQVLRGSGVGVSNTDIDDEYLLTLPLCTHQQKDRSSTTAELQPHDTNYLAQLTLPEWSSAFEIGDQFPKGSIYLKCHETNEIFTEAEYIYEDSHRLKVRKIDLGDDGCGQTYCLLTVGTDITSSIDDIRRKLQEHTHDRTLGGVGVPLSSITDALDTFADGAPGVFYYPEPNICNYLPQYMHRGGFLYRDIEVQNVSLPQNKTRPAETRGHIILGNTAYGTENNNEYGRRYTTGSTNISLNKTEQHPHDPYLNAYLGPFEESFHISFGGLPKRWFDRPGHEVKTASDSQDSNQENSLDQYAPQIYRSQYGEFRFEGMENPWLRQHKGDLKIGNGRGHGPDTRSIFSHFLTTLDDSFFWQGNFSALRTIFDMDLNTMVDLAKDEQAADRSEYDNYDIDTGPRASDIETYESLRHIGLIRPAINMTESINDSEIFLAGGVYGPSDQYTNSQRVTEYSDYPITAWANDAPHVHMFHPATIKGLGLTNRFAPSVVNWSQQEVLKDDGTGIGFGGAGNGLVEAWTDLRENILQKQKLTNASGLGLYSANNINIHAFPDNIEDFEETEVSDGISEHNNYGLINIESAKKIFLGSKQFSADIEGGSLFKSSQVHYLLKGTTGRTEHEVFNVQSGRLAFSSKPSLIPDQEYITSYNALQSEEIRADLPIPEQLSDYIDSHRKLKLLSKKDMLLHSSGGKMTFSTNAHSTEHIDPASGHFDTLQKYGRYEQTHRTNMFIQHAFSNSESPVYTCDTTYDYSTGPEDNYVSWDQFLQLHPEFSNRMYFNPWKVPQDQRADTMWPSIAYFSQCNRYLKSPDKWNSSVANASQHDEFNTSCFSFHTKDLDTREYYDRPKENQTFAGVGIFNPEEVGPPGNKYYFNPALAPAIADFVSPWTDNWFNDGFNEPDVEPQENATLWAFGNQLADNTGFNTWDLSNYKFYRVGLRGDSVFNWLGTINKLYNGFCKTIFTPVSAELWVKGKVNHRAKRVAIFEDAEIGAGSLYYGTGPDIVGGEGENRLSYLERNRRSMITYQTRKSYIELGVCKYLWQTFLDKDGLPMGQIRSAPYQGVWTDPNDPTISGMDPVYGPTEVSSGVSGERHELHYLSQFTLIAGYYHSPDDFGVYDSRPDVEDDNENLSHRAMFRDGHHEDGFVMYTHENPADLGPELKNTISAAGGWFAMPYLTGEDNTRNFNSYAGVFTPFRFAWNDDPSTGWSGRGSQIRKLYAASNTRSFLQRISSGGIGSIFAYHDKSTHEPHTGTWEDSGHEPLLVQEAGAVQYITRGADYGELLEVGDKEEWGPAPFLTWEESVHAGDGVTPFGIPSGTIVYIRDQKVWMTGPGTPMAVTTRSAVIGNNINTKNPWVVVSFIGQLPVFIHGPAKQGDYLIPDIHTPMAVRAIDKDECSFEDYKKAIGTCWQDAIDKHELELHQVMCAIGVK